MDTKCQPDVSVKYQELLSVRFIVQFSVDFYTELEVIDVQKTRRNTMQKRTLQLYEFFANSEKNVVFFLEYK